MKNIFKKENLMPVIVLGAICLVVAALMGAVNMITGPIIQKAEEQKVYDSLRVVLDGVFSHTGSDSEYFNRENRYDTLGAYQSPSSPYYNWFHFRRWPNDYGSWWGFETLPEVNETHPAFMEYINGENGIVRHWIKTGIGGWRLDVADELSDE